MQINQYIKYIDSIDNASHNYIIITTLFSPKLLMYTLYLYYNII